jgi:putative ATP-dependent endonuclease of the OLD family
VGRLTALSIKNYRSIGDEIKIRFPEGLPLVLLGENNVGKSNVARALDLVLGERWPGSWDPDDHDFHQRDKSLTIEIVASLQDVGRENRYGNWEPITAFILRYPPQEDRFFLMEIDGASENAYVPNEVREQCRCIVIGADRRLSYELSYASKYTLLSKVMRRFHESLTADPDRVASLKDGFSDVKALFEEVPEFATFRSELQAQSDELSSNLDYRLAIDFSAYDPSHYFHALKVAPMQNDDVRTFDELGTGQGQMLALAFTYAYAKAFKGGDEGLVLVIEEPEAHLHPLAQRWVARRIRDVAAEGVQVLVTTHSPAFLDIMGLEGMVLLKKDDAVTYASQFTAEQLAMKCAVLGAKSTATSILPFYAAAATEELLAGFFARTVVLVEGPTESFAFPTLLRKINTDVEREGIAVISCQGVGNLAKWYRMFTVYGIPTYLVFDNDSKEDADESRRRDLLQTLAVPEGDRAAILSSSSFLIADSYAVCGVNFEETMRTLFAPDYEQLEAEASDLHGLTTKPLVARYAADNLPDDHAGWRSIKDLDARIKSKS